MKDVKIQFKCTVPKPQQHAPKARFARWADTYKNRKSAQTEFLMWAGVTP